MFWYSIINGLGKLGHYQVWIVFFALFLLQYLVLMLCGGIAMAGREHSAAREATGGILMMILPSLVSAIALPVAVLYLIPLLNGMDQTNSLSDILSLWPSLVKAGGLALVISFVFAFIPIIGRLADAPGGTQFIQLVIIYILITAGTDITLPSMWVTLLFLIFGIVFLYITLFIIFAISGGDPDSTRARVLGLFFGSVSGFIIFFMYNAYTIQLNLSLQ